MNKLTSATLILGSFAIVGLYGYKEYKSFQKAAFYQDQARKIRQEADQAEAEYHKVKKLNERLEAEEQAVEEDLEEEPVQPKRVVKKVKRSVSAQAAESPTAPSVQKEVRLEKKASKQKEITVEEARDALDNVHDMKDSVEGMLGF